MNEKAEIIHVLSSKGYGGSKQLNIAGWKKTEWEATGTGDEKRRIITNPEGLEFYDYQTGTGKHTLIPKDAPIEKSDPEREAAQQLLNNPAIFTVITVHEMNKKIVGEIESRQTVFLCAIGALCVEEPSLAAYNLMVNSKSGAGKDHVTKSVLKLVPKERVESRTRISPTAFTYWHNKKFEPEWTWDGKVCYLSDISNTILNHEVFKVMCTEGSTATVTINNRAVDIVITGKPALFITTASAMPNDEMLRRFPILELDETIDQTTAIMKREAEYAAKGLSTEYSSTVKRALSLLERVRVKVPFAPLMVSAFPPKHIIMRTHFSRLLNYVKASAALHQFQRQSDAEGYILAEPADYEIARIALKKTTSNPFMVPLTKFDKRIIEECGKETGWFSVPDIVHRITFMSEKSLYVHLSQLVEVGFFEVDKHIREHSDKPVTVYHSRFFDVSIPSWDEICSNSTIASRPTIPSVSSNPSIPPEKQEASEESKAIEAHFVPLITENKTLFDQFRDLFMSNYQGRPAPIEGVQRVIPLVTDEIIEFWKGRGDVVESPPGWVRPL